MTQVENNEYELILDVQDDGFTWVLSGDLVFDTLPAKFDLFESKMPTKDGLNLNDLKKKGNYNMGYSLQGFASF